MERTARQDKLNDAYSKPGPCPFCHGSGMIRFTRGLSTPEEWAEVVEEEAHRFGLLPADLTGPSRQKRVAEARHRAMARLREEFDLPLKEIGRFLGDRHHATIIHGIRRGTEYLTREPCQKVV